MAKPSRPWSVKGIGEPVRDVARRQSKAAGMTIGRWIDQAIQRRLMAQGDGRLSMAALGELVDKVAISEQNIEVAFRPLLYELRTLAARVVAVEKTLTVSNPATEALLVGVNPNNDPDRSVEPLSAVAWALPLAEKGLKPLGLFYSADPQVHFQGLQALVSHRRLAPIAPDSDFSAELSGLYPPPTAPTGDLSALNFATSAPLAMTSQQPDPQTADLESAVQAPQAHEVDASTIAAGRATVRSSATFHTDDDESAAEAPDNPDLELASSTYANGGVINPRHSGVLPQRPRRGVWVLAIVLVFSLVAATLWTMRPALLAFGVSPTNIARLVGPLDRAHSITVAWLKDFTGEAMAPTSNGPPQELATTNATADRAAVGGAPASVPSAGSGSETMPAIEVPAPPPVADIGLPSPTLSDNVVSRQMAVALARLADPADPVADTWAAQTLREAAIEGIAEAQYALAVLYQRGRGVNQDPIRALLWYHSAAEQGHAPAQFNLGIFHLKALGVPRNYSEARRWFTRAADQRLWQAEFNLGVLYERGVLGVPDLNAASAHYRRAAGLGGAQAEKRLATLEAGEIVAPAFLGILNLSWATND